MTNRKSPVGLAYVLNCGISGIEIEEISRDFADSLRKVRHSQKSPAAKNRTTGSAIYSTLKMSDKNWQEN